MKQTIAIIGAAGRYGAEFAKALATGPYRLLLMDPNQEALPAIQKEISDSGRQPDVEMISCCKEASWESDIILFTLPFSERDHLVAKMQEVVTRKTVIFLLEKPEENALALLKKQLPYSGIAIVAMYLPASAGNSERISGNDAEATHTARNLLQQIHINEIISSLY
ncbi:MAG TPA: NAD(P)-binding domain-containing protein [Sediminibacterium sp.]|nr:NAD(P)-binding domain-containing protein [Sediminibacterium sp.]